MQHPQRLRCVLAVTRLVLCLMICVGPARAQSDVALPDRPNILFVIVDDLGYADLGCYGSAVIETPHLDALAAGGLRFTDAYSGCTVCGPARSTLMTGTHMGHTSMRINTGGASLLDEDVTVAEVLRDAGYRTGGFGKWGLGDLGTPGAPELQGFDRFFGYYHQIHAHDYFPVYLIDTGEKVPLPLNEGVPWGGRAGGVNTLDPPRTYTQDLIVEEMKGFVRDAVAAGEPFFAYGAWCIPHGDYNVPGHDPAWVRYADEPWDVRARAHAAMTVIMDRQMGELVALLEELGVREETLVVFVSDNGADYRFEGETDSSGPLRGYKRSMHEGGLRVPMIVSWPGVVESGESALPTYFPDWLPTLAALAGAEAPAGLDGLSIVPTLTGVGEQAMHDYLYWEWARYDWGARVVVPGGLMQAIRVGEWKAVKDDAASAVELYHLPTDIGEAHDRAGELPELAAVMGALMRNARVEMRPQAEPAHPAGRAFN